MRSLIKKLPGYRWRLGHEWQMWRGRVSERNRRRAFEAWLRDFQTSRAELLIGSNFVEFGGCRHHMHAIQKFSTLRAELAPSERVLASVPAGCFSGEFRDAFMKIPPPPGVRAIHTHVFPWLVDWCHHHRDAGFRWIHTHHNWYYSEFTREGDPLEPWQETLNETFLFALQHCDVPLCVSKWQRDFMKREHDVESTYLPNGVDVPLCDRGRADRFRRRHHLAGPFLLYVGRNDPVKNPADFVHLALAMPAQRFVMIGDGLTAETLRDEWQVDAPANLTLPGPASHKGVQDAIAACSVLVVTSKREGLPTLVMEGMAHRKPVVVPDEAGCMEAIGDGEFGYIYQQGNIVDLAANVELAMKDAAIGIRARQRVLDEYDWRVVAPKLDAIYRGGVPS
jgi:glycosyltransferase involved in cell wall biosynthesis